MKALRAIVRTLSGSARQAGSAIGSGPVELTGGQLEHVAGGGGALGGVIGSVRIASPTPAPDGGKGGISGTMG